MYLEFFKLRESPFQLVADARYFYAGADHQEALAGLEETITRRRGLAVLTGEPGCGKSFLVGVLEARLGASAQLAKVSRPPDSPRQLLRATARALGIDARNDDDRLALSQQLEAVLETSLRRGRVVAVVFDEAQDLPDDALEEIRLLWNMETQGQRLLQIVLAGQGQLRDRLRQDRWEALRQRVAIACHLGSFNRPDTFRYVIHRCRIAAEAECQMRFTQHALESIYHYSRGLPRKINQLCENVLILAAARGTLRIHGSLVDEAASRMLQPARHRPSVVGVSQLPSPRASGLPGQAG